MNSHFRSARGSRGGRGGRRGWGVGRRSWGSGSGGSRSWGGSGGGTSVTHLQVFLEGRSGRDTLAGIVVLKSIGVTGIGHTSGTDFGTVEESGGKTALHGGGEGDGTSGKGGKDGELHGVVGWMN